jgi:H+/Cl- antiporter ClcA
MISFRRLIFYSFCLGILVGLTSTAYYLALTGGTHLVWELIPQWLHFKHPEDFSSSAWIFTTIGGFIVGVTAHYLGAFGGLDLAIKEIHETGNIDFKPGMTITSLFSLIFGSSVGPEAPLVDIHGSMGSWLAARLNLTKEMARILTFCGIGAALGAFFGAPMGCALLTLELPHKKGLEYYEAIIPVMVSSIMGFIVFRVMTGTTIGGKYVFPEYSKLDILDFWYAVILGVVGAGIAILTILIMRGTKKLFQPSFCPPILLTTLGGLSLGLMAKFLPLTLFFGEAQIQTVIDTGTQLGAGILLLTALGKMLTLSLSIWTGFRGGFIFVLLFIGTTIGKAISLLIPSIHPTVAIVSMMASVLVAALKTPMSGAIIISAISGVELIPIVTISTLVSYLLTSRFSLLQNQRSRTESPYHN